MWKEPKNFGMHVWRHTGEHLLNYQQFDLSYSTSNGSSIFDITNLPSLPMILWIQVLLPEYYNFFKSAILYLVTWLILLLTKLLSLNQNSKSITIGALQHAVTSPGRWYSSHTSGPIRGHRRRQGSHSQLAFSPQPPHLYHSHQRLRGIHIKACICFTSFVYPYPSSWNSLLLCIDKLSINPIFKLSALIILFPAVQTNKRIDGFLASYSLAHHSNITILEFLLAWMLNACLALPDAHLQMLIRGLHSERQQWCSKIHCMFHSDTHLQVLFHIHLQVLISGLKSL